MATKQALKVQAREGKGKGAARTLRRGGLVPGIIYGHEFETTHISTETKAAEQVYRQAGGHEILKVHMEGQKGSFDAIIKDVQIDPVSRHMIHIDLLRIRADKEITVEVPIRFDGTPKGVKEFGGILQHGIREVAISCLPKDLPESIPVDVSELMIHDSIHVKDVVFPAGVTLKESPDELIATVLPPVVMKLEAELEAPVTLSPQEEKEKAEAAAGGETEAKEKGKGKEKEKEKEKGKEKEKE